MADISPDVMKRFLSGFQAGSGAAESSGRLNLAASGQAMDFVQSQQRLAAQREAQQAEIQQNNLKLTYQQQAQSAQNALAAQKMQNDMQQSAMQYKLQEQNQSLERVAFVERLKAQRALAEQNRLELAARVENIEKDNAFKKEQLALQRQALDKKSDYQTAVLEQRKEHDKMQTDLRNRTVLKNQFEQTMAIAADPLKGSQFRTADGQIDQQKVYDFAAANSRRILDSTGMSKPGLPTKEELAEEKKAEAKVDTTGNSQQSPAKEKGILERFVDKRALDWAENNPDDPRAKRIKARLGVQ